jgi:hypothetical protein
MYVISPNRITPCFTTFDISLLGRDLKTTVATISDTCGEKRPENVWMMVECSEQRSKYDD